MEQLIDRFHKMEISCKLFDNDLNIGVPIWDIIRYHVYLKYYYSAKYRERLSEKIKHPKKNYIWIVKNLFKLIFTLIFKRFNNIIITHSRYFDNEGNDFDKSAASFIETLKKDCLIIETLPGKKLKHSYIYDFSNILRKFYPKKKVPISYYLELEKTLITNLGFNEFSYDELNHIYNTYRSQYFYYSVIFQLKKPKNIIICSGNPKASLKAANNNKMKTFLVQHAGIEKDEIDYSYPIAINSDSHILFPDTILTFGSYWGRNINIPTKKIIPIGNDFFYSTPKSSTDESILIISTIVHGEELKELTKNLAARKQDLSFIYKLHPNEFQYKNYHVDFFNENKNVKVISIEKDTNLLISKCQLVILIVSAVLYEALHHNKKVVVYKKINYERQLIFSESPNVYFIESEVEIDDILNKKFYEQQFDFYNKTDYSMLESIFNIQGKEVIY